MVIKHAQIGSQQVQNLQSHNMFLFFFLYSTLSENITRIQMSLLNCKYRNTLVTMKTPEDTSPCADLFLTRIGPSTARAERTSCVWAWSWPASSRPVSRVTRVWDINVQQRSGANPQIFFVAQGWCKFRYHYIGFWWSYSGFQKYLYLLRFIISCHITTTNIYVFQ